MDSDQNSASEFEHFKELFNEFDEGSFSNNGSPLLAHYTSVKNLESILNGEELWLANPLFMNDLNEVRFGIGEGEKIFRESSEVKAVAGDLEKYLAVMRGFDAAFEHDRNSGALDSYIFCLSEHDYADIDGRLSMWRSYGDSGEGASIVFDFGAINAHHSSRPFALTKVRYKSEEDQITLLNELIKKWCVVVRSANMTLEGLEFSGEIAFHLVKFFALCTKHIGFEEEQEWRIIYSGEFDFENSFSKCKSYSIGKRGVEPKLKLKISDLAEFLGLDFNVESLVDKIILGPSSNGNLALHSTKRMLENIGKAKASSKTILSRIPFRS